MLRRCFIPPKRFQQMTESFWKVLQISINFDGINHLKMLTNKNPKTHTQDTALKIGPPITRDEVVLVAGRVGPNSAEPRPPRKDTPLLSGSSRGPHLSTARRVPSPVAKLVNHIFVYLSTTYTSISVLLFSSSFYFHIHLLLNLLKLVQLIKK